MSEEEKLAQERAYVRHVLELKPHTAAMMCRIIEKLKPPPKLTLSQWADKYRMLNAKASAMPGPWRTDNAPWLREIMDAMSDPRIRKVVVMCCAQVGKTDGIILNAAGYNMHYAPGPMMIMEPTIEMAEALSKDRLTPMIEDSPELNRLVAGRSRGSGNTILKKDFPGGAITLVGANSPAGLRSRPVKILLADEVDAYPQSAGDEGDPLLLAAKRTTTFWDSKIGMVSTPTEEGTSRIKLEYDAGTQKEWCLPCPECGEYQPMVWANLHGPNGGEFDKNDTGNLTYTCAVCGCICSEYQWRAQRAKGKYIARNPGAPHESYHMNTIGAGFGPWKDMVDKFLQANEERKAGSIDQMKVWVNTELGEVWSEPGETVEAEELMNRCEPYQAEVPDEVRVLTAGVDTQDDRFEVEVVGWNETRQSWGIRYQKIYGDLTQPTVWADLDRFLRQPFYKANGEALYLRGAFMDSQGHFQEKVLPFCKEREFLHFHGIKGVAGFGKEYPGKPSTNNRQKIEQVIVGVDAGKARVYHSLRVLDESAPLYCHFPKNPEAGYYKDEYFRGLAAEKEVIRMRMGRPVKTWEIKDHRHKRNEPLDCRNYATACLEFINPPELKRPDERTAPPAGRKKLSGGIR